MTPPLATYRLQFRREFGFRRAAKVLDYLARLGVTDIYASPVFRARRGSTHGYDIVDPNALNAELGTEEEFFRLTGEASARGLGWIQDIVPNHMAFDDGNAMLMDVLESGPRSEYAPYFDIEWEHPFESVRGRLLAPFLGDLFGAVVDRCEIGLRRRDDGFRIEYGGSSFPLRIESYAVLLGRCAEGLPATPGEERPGLAGLHAVIGALDGLDGMPAGEERRNRVSSVKKSLADLCGRSPEVKRRIDAVLRRCTEGKPAGFLEEILSRQWFRLAFWKVANEEINYRRFFNINGLISLRTEKEDVFRTVHGLVGELLREERITGLRVDHVDGLADPGEYLARLRQLAGEHYVVVEKILEEGEELPLSWPVQGTTGYDFLNTLNAFFCEVKNGRSFNRIYYTFTGIKKSLAVTVREKKKLVLEKHMAGDVDNLTLLLEGVSSRDRYGIDLTRQGLRRALVEVLVSFPVYRTYISRAEIPESDRDTVKAAAAAARERSPGLIHELDFIERFLLLEGRKNTGRPEDVPTDRFVKRFQQCTGPLMAKGFEDTVFYVYNRLLSLNEVGGSPDRFGRTPGEFHRFLRRRSLRAPQSMNATGTHDTKRGEDARARISVLSEMPKRWEAALRRWHRGNRQLKRFTRGKEMPDRNDEYMLYQAMVGSFPFDEGEIPRFRERLQAFAVKAVREAKVHTAWLKPDSDYEEAFLSFINALLASGEGNLFLRDFKSFHEKVARYGVYSSLSQTLVKITAPGVPDFYQGAELWDFSFVDPDNRRLVDFELRERLLEEICGKEGDLPALAREVISSFSDGRVKLFLIRRALAARRERAEVFQRGDYSPLRVAGHFGRHVLCFARRYRKGWAVTVAPRLTMTLEEKGGGADGGVWGRTAIEMPAAAPRSWRNAFTGRTLERGGALALGEVLADFPVALLLST